MPTSPRRRPRIHPLVKVRAAQRGDDTAAVAMAGGENEEEEPVFDVVSPSKGRKASDEYVLDESR